ncbi:MAG TPA: excinuclease ABC subunit UvrB [Patescibacteria group bacterium]|nr:excinuclease ABC subunit UvrB [Patescibacteria group bacterium]
MNFKLVSTFNPTGDQPTAIEKLNSGLKKNYKFQTLLGVTGSGKTFAMANLIAKYQKPTLIISHNKTLAAQLTSEFRQFFPENSVNYFVSYYDYYQPEAYLPRTDTYIEKETNINDEIDRLRHAATQALATRKDVIIVASVSCIFGLGSPVLYDQTKISLAKNQNQTMTELFKKLVAIQYRRNDFEMVRGSFRPRGDVLEILPAYGEEVIRLEFFGNRLEKILTLSPISGEVISTLNNIDLFPATHYITDESVTKLATAQIRQDLKKQVSLLKNQDKILEAHRLESRTNFDLEMIQETGFCSGIENYSRYFDRRQAGKPPFTLLDFFPKDFLLIIDESHMTVPQIRGMYNQDKARKQTLVDFGFRLPSAMDNRPLNFEEFEKRLGTTIFTTATPGPFELEKSNQVVEQIIRPTGLIDPEIEIRPTQGQISDLIVEVKKRIASKQRVLITTLTKRLAEELTEFLVEKGIKTAYLHHEIDTLERPQILRDLRLGVYDVLVGINLLREGLDLPEVSLVAILDAGKEGFLRSRWSLIQVMGRAARHQMGQVIMYADKTTKSMREAIAETGRRRKIQLAHNLRHGIKPQSIQKEIGEEFIAPKEEVINLDKIPKDELKRLIVNLQNQMELASKNLQFEKAAEIRDEIIELKKAAQGSKVRIKKLFE